MDNWPDKGWSLDDEKQAKSLKKEKRLKVLVLGETNSGKTTIANFIMQKLAERGIEAELLDVDANPRLDIQDRRLDHLADVAKVHIEVVPVMRVK